MIKCCLFYQHKQVDMLRILTDRGTEYCGAREHHEFELYLTTEDIDRTKIKAKNPQTNGICERFHRTMQDEFYAIAFRKKMYQCLEALQADLDSWMAYYNNERPHSGRCCYGRIPMETFADSKALAIEKNAARLFGQSANLASPGQAEAGNAGEQPARNNPDDGNDKAADLKTAALPQNHFYHHV